MRAIYRCFLQMMWQLKQDAMLLMIALVPLLAGVFIRFVIPVAEKWITGYLGTDAFLAPYYEVFDLLLIILTPTMFNYAVAMVILEEADDRMISYLAVTPLGKTGYLCARLGITGLLSFPATIFMSALFHLSPVNGLMLTGISFAGSVQGVIIALLIVTLSKNKVEGMAVGKMTTLYTAGACAPYFITGNMQYMLSVLPSYWMAKAMQSSNYAALLISILSAGLWIILLFKKFITRAAV